MRMVWLQPLQNRAEPCHPRACGAERLPLPAPHPDGGAVVQCSCFFHHSPLVRALRREGGRARTAVLR